MLPLNNSARLLLKPGQILTTGATVGLPYYAAFGAKLAGGMSIGFSPAASLREHLRKYRLPYDCYDFVNFTWAALCWPRPLPCPIERCCYNRRWPFW